jgi:lipocalin-like protein
MTKFVIAMFAVLYASASFAYDEEDFIGTWKLVSASMRNVENGEVSDAYGGPHPTGFLSYGRDHRVIAMAAYDRRFKPARVDQSTPEQRDELFLTYFAYAGTFTVSGNSIQHHIEASWNETWTGTTVIRDFKFEIDKLILTTRPQLRPNGKTYVITLTWEKIK